MRKKNCPLLLEPLASVNVIRSDVYDEPGSVTNTCWITPPRTVAKAAALEPPPPVNVKNGPIS